MLDSDALKKAVTSAGPDASAESSHTAKTMSGDDNDVLGQAPVKSVPSQPVKDSVLGSDTTTNVAHERTHGEHAHSRHRAKRETNHKPSQPPPPTDPGPRMCGPQLPTSADVVYGPQLPSALDVVCGPQLPIDGIPYNVSDVELESEKPRKDGDHLSSSSKASHSEASSKVSVLSEARFVRHRHLVEKDALLGSSEEGGSQGSQTQEGKESGPEDDEADAKAGHVTDDEEESDEDFDDLDIIDKQLELALEKKKVGAVTWMSDWYFYSSCR